MTSLTFRFLLFFLAVGTCHGQEIYEVETLPCLRTKQYPLNSYNKIIVFSPPRTGSSVVYNAVRFLFEDNNHLLSFHDSFDKARSVLKTHKIDLINAIKDRNALYIVTIRDPLQSCISNYRIYPYLILDNQDFAKKLVARYVNYFSFLEKMKKNGYKTALLKYEDFGNNLEYLFNFIEEQLQITIENTDKETMRLGYSKENVYNCTLHLSDFKECLPISGFHGQHITFEPYNPPDEFIHWVQVYLHFAKPLLKRYGYYVD